MDTNYLNHLSLITANFNDGEIIETILKDWFNFLGGKPNEVVIIDGGSNKQTHDTYWRLFQAGQIDKLQVIQSNHRENDKETCYIQEYFAGALATNPYILWFKFDTLPYRIDNLNWLEEAIHYLEREDIFAISGAFNRSWETLPAWDGYYFCKACTINFALMKRDSYMAAMDEFAGKFISSGFTGTHPFKRFLIEKAFIEYMKCHNLYTLCKVEDPSWTIFHTNAHGEQLKEARKQFLARKNLSDFMNPALSKDPTRFAYYFFPIEKANFFYTLRIIFGTTKLGFIWQQMKKRFFILIKLKRKNQLH